MNYRVVFFIIAITLVVMGSVLFFVISSGAKGAQTVVLTQSESVSFDNDAVNKGLFTVGTPSFFTQNHSCRAGFMDDVYVSVSMLYSNPPRSCSFFVNDRYVRTQRDLQPSCVGSCPSGEFSRTFLIDELDVRDSHTLRVCCNDICTQRRIAAVCS
ncbi:MAG: hypothetical protein ACMXYD_03160 [Candidatus Woesearchaeota archaeon]